MCIINKQNKQNKSLKHYPAVPGHRGSRKKAGSKCVGKYNAARFLRARTMAGRPGRIVLACPGGRQEGKGSNRQTIGPLTLDRVFLPDPKLQNCKMGP